MFSKSCDLYVYLQAYEQNPLLPGEYAGRYKLVLPSEEELRAELEHDRSELGSDPDTP